MSSPAHQMRVLTFREPGLASQLSEHLARLIEQPEERLLIFDFDGVLGSKWEDWVYTLAKQDYEPALFQKLHCALELPVASYDHQYQRHLLYQAALHKLDRSIPAGPALPAAQMAQEQETPFYVLTARSGRHAIKRMWQFLDAHRLQPMETFHVGRTEKHLQIRYLLEKIPDAHITFIEDSSEHLDVMQEKIPEPEFQRRLELVLLKHEAPDHRKVEKESSATLHAALEPK